MKKITFFVVLIFAIGTSYGQNCETNVKNLLANVDALIQSNPSKAIAKLNEVLNKCLVDKDSFDIFFGDLYHKLGYASYANSQDAQAIVYFNLAIKLRSQSPGYYNKSTANSFYLRSEAYFYLENYEQSLMDTESAIEITKKIEYPNRDSSLARFYMTLANSLRAKGDFNSALVYQTKAANSILFSENMNLIIFFYTGKAQILYGAKKYDLAKKDYEQVKRLYEGKPDKNNLYYYRTSLNDLGLIYLEEQQLNHAISYFNNALALHLQSVYPDTAEIINLHANLLNAYSQKNELEQADSIFNAGLDLAKRFYKKNPYQNVMSELYYFKAVVERKKQHYQNALNHHQKSIAILVPSFDYETVNQNPILSQYPTGDKTRLRTALNLKAQTYQQKYQAKQKSTDLKAAFETYLTLDTLITQTRQSFKAAGSKYFLQAEIVPIYEQAIKVALQLYESSAVTYYQEMALQLISRNKAILLVEGLQDEKIKLKHIPADLLAEEKRLHTAYNQLEAEIYSAEQEGQDTLVEQLEESFFATKRTYDLLIEQFERDYPTYAQHKHGYAATVAVQALQQKLPTDQAVIEFFVGDTTIFVSTITKDFFKVNQLPKPVNFNEYCADFIKMTRGNGLEEAKFSLLSHQLYQDLLAVSLAPLEGIDRLIIIPDDILLKLPWDVLLTKPHTIQPETWGEETIPYLVKNYAISQVFASSLLFEEQDQQRVEQAMKSFGGFGIEYRDSKQDTFAAVDSLLQRSLGPLLYSDEEVREAQKVMGGDTLINQAANKKYFLEHRKDYNILHFAMHGLANAASPLNSALVFAKTTDTTDNLLRAADIYNLDLTADLVVLSACQTLTGTLNRGEGMRTLSRAFAFAGCPNLIASLWSIPDKSTKEVFTHFYKKLKAGQPMDVALQKAKLAYLANIGEANEALPSRWAQTVAIGTPKSINFECTFSYLHYGLLLLVGFFIFEGFRRYS